MSAAGADRGVDAALKAQATARANAGRYNLSLKTLAPTLNTCSPHVVVATMLNSSAKLALVAVAAVSNSAHKHLYAHRIRRIRVYFTCHDRDVLQRHNNGTWQS